MLFIQGNAKISQKDFLKDDLNIHGCKDFITPMKLCVYLSSVKNARTLINRGVIERPFYLGLIRASSAHESHFSCLPDYLDRCKKRISDCLLDYEMEYQMLVLLISHPNKELNDEMDKIKRSNNEMLFLSFFVWAAKNNRSDLLSNPAFNELFIFFRKAASRAIKVAALFGSIQFIMTAMPFVDTDAIRKGALEMAVLTFNHELLTCIVNSLLKQSIRLQENKFTEMRALRLAINLQNTKALAYLLDKGVDLSYKEPASQGSYLHDAVAIYNIDTVKLILKYAPQLLEQKTRFGKTPLHVAVCFAKTRNDKDFKIASLLISEYGANINAKNERGKTPLDYIKNTETKRALLKLSNVKDMPNKNIKIDTSIFSNENKRKRSDVMIKDDIKKPKQNHKAVFPFKCNII